MPVVLPPRLNARLAVRTPAPAPVLGEDVLLLEQQRSSGESQEGRPSTEVVPDRAAALTSSSHTQARLWRAADRAHRASLFRTSAPYTNSEKFTVPNLSVTEKAHWRDR